MDLFFKTDAGSFNYRIGGVVIHNGKVLLLTEDRFDFWYLPGGRACLFETSEEALKREIFEELGEAPIVERILWTTECLYYFEAWKTKHHDLTFYYLISFPEGAFIYSLDSGMGTEEFSNEETKLHFKWFEIDSLEEVNLVPHFLKSALKNIALSSYFFAFSFFAPLSHPLAFRDRDKVLLLRQSTPNQTYHTLFVVVVVVVVVYIQINRVFL